MAIISRKISPDLAINKIWSTNLWSTMAYTLKTKVPSRHASRFLGGYGFLNMSSTDWYWNLFQICLPACSWHIPHTSQKSARTRQVLCRGSHKSSWFSDTEINIKKYAARVPALYPPNIRCNSNQQQGVVTFFWWPLLQECRNPSNIQTLILSENLGMHKAI
jgi:hypothetical protein